MNSIFLEKLIAEIKPQLEKTHITNVHVVNSSTFVLSLYNSNDKKLFISLEKNNPYINLVPIENMPTTLDNGLSQKLRHFLRDGFVYEVSQENDDAIIRLLVRQKVEENTYQDYQLIVELINKEPCLLILDENNLIKLSTHYQNEGFRKLLINEAYEYPSKNKKFIHKMDELEKYNKKFSALYKKALEKRRKEKYRPILNALNSKIKLQERKIEKLLIDIENGEELKRYQEYGDLPFYTPIDEVYKILDEANLKYDTTLKPNDLAKKMFEMAKKGKRKIEFATEQLEKTEKSLSYYKYLYYLTSTYNEEEMDALTVEILGSSYKSRQKHNTKNAKEPYKVTIDATEFYFGVNRVQNNTLTFHRANENEIFLHIRNYPGSHIVIRKNEPTDNDLINGSMLALALSNETSGEVDYCKVRYVKSTETLGLVTMTHASTIKINDVDSKVIKALKSREKIK